MADESSDEETVRSGGFELTFYPGFASACTVTDADGGVHELYRQTRAFHLPPGQTRPRTHHKLRLRGGSRKQDVTIDIRDPNLRIARITIELYGEDYHEDGRERSVAQTMNVPNDPVMCPPTCT